MCADIVQLKLGMSLETQTIKQAKPLATASPELIN